MAKAVSFSAAIGELFEAVYGAITREELDKAFSSNGNFRSAKAKNSGGFSKSGFKTSRSFDSRVTKAEAVLTSFIGRAARKSGNTKTKEEIESLIKDINIAAGAGAAATVAAILQKVPDPYANMTLGVLGGRSPKGDFIIQWTDLNGTSHTNILELKYYQDLTSAISYYSAKDETMFGAGNGIYKYLQTTANQNPDFWQVYNNGRRLINEEWLSHLNTVGAFQHYIDNIRSKFGVSNSAEQFYSFLKEKSAKNITDDKTIVRGFNSITSGNKTINSLTFSMEAVMRALMESEGSFNLINTTNKIRITAGQIPIMDLQTEPIGSPFNSFIDSEESSIRQVPLKTIIPKEYFNYALNKI